MIISKNRRSKNRRSYALLVLLVVFVIQSGAAQVWHEPVAKRATLAIKYPDGEGTSVDLVGTALHPRVFGKAEVKRTEARTRIHLEIANLGHPQHLGSFYTTYVLWAVAPEGQADNLAELPIFGGDDRDIEVTTNYQTFGLIITAEPHAMVKLPGPAIVAENALRKSTKGSVTASRIEYRGYPGHHYASSRAEDARALDFNTPLRILGARRAVELARLEGALQYAEAELREAEIKLAALEQIWPARRKDERRFRGEAQDVMRLAELARSVAEERRGQARLDAERREANQTIARAELEAETAKEEAADYREALARSESELALARKRVDEAQNDADRARANEELARVEAERAQLEADQARRDRDAAQQKLFVSLSAILDTRREARGLIVSLSDVLFDFDRATLKPGAKEKLSKLAGILLAYPGRYTIEIEGHTDAIGSEQYNLKLSDSRASSVHAYLQQAGIAQDRIIAVRGFGKSRPVATNDTAEGRQMNRRVEIVIADEVTVQQ